MGKTRLHTTGTNVVVIDPADNVATALVDLAAGTPLRWAGGDGVTTVEPIPSGHKVALRDISAGDPVLKYGQVIGVASTPVEHGSLVHTHNLTGQEV
jgi:altronate dehydratase